MLEILKIPQKTGVYVTDVGKNSAAEYAGFQIGDILLAVNGQSIENVHQLSTQIASIGAGNIIAIAGYRRSNFFTVYPQLMNKPNEKQIEQTYYHEIPSKVTCSKEHIKADNFNYARKKELSFYPNTELWEFGKFGSSCLVSYIVPNKEIPILLDGSSKPIRKFNSRIGLQLKNVEFAKEYLKFVTAHLWGEGGASKILMNKNEMPVSIPGEQINFKPLKVNVKDNIYVAQAFVMHSGGLYDVELEIQRDGHVNMVGNKKIISNFKNSGISFKNQQRCYVKAEELAVKNYPLSPSIDGRWSNVSENELLIVRQLILSSEK